VVGLCRRGEQGRWVIELSGPSEGVFSVCIFRLGVCTFGKEEFDVGSVLFFAGCGIEEGRHAANVFGVDVGTSIEEGLYDGGIAVGGGEHERADAFELDVTELDLAGEGVLLVDVGTEAEEVFDETNGTTGDRLSGSEASAIDRFHVGTGGDEEPCVFFGAGIAEGAEEGRAALCGAFVRLSTGGEEELNAFRGSRRTGSYGECVLSHLSFGFDISAFGEECFDLGWFGGGGDKRSNTEGVGFVWTGTGGEKEVYGISAAEGGSPDEGRVLATVLYVVEGTVLGFALKPGEVVVADSL